MRKNPRFRSVVAAATGAVLALAAGWAAAGPAAGATPPASAPTDAPPSAVETFAYPGSAQILASRGITLTRGDGGILLTDCGKAGSFQIKVLAITTPQNPDDSICFAAPGASGYLALSIPNAFRVFTYGRSVRASLSTDQKPTETVDVVADGSAGIGESLDPKSRAVVLELRVTGSKAPLTPQPTDPATAFTAKLNIGDGKRACTGTLVDRNWLLTAASCFTDTPNDLSTVTVGAPKDKTVATIGRTDLANTGTGVVADVVELVPRQDRDLVMARLAVPVGGITPAALTTATPATGQTLRIPGYGRTATEWVPRSLRTTTHTTAAVSATTFDTVPSAGQAPLCQGDAGAPLLRDNGGRTELAAVATRSWQGGCLDTPATETRTGATATRADDLASWIQQVRWRTASVKNSVTKRCLYVSWRTPDNNAQAQQIDCAPAYLDQLWKLEPVTGGGYQFRNPVTNRCLYVSWRTPENNAPVQQFDCNPEWGDQVWRLDPVAAGGYQIRNSVTNRCMYVSWRTPENNAPVQQFDCNPDWGDQVWQF
ncbi:RICIN domain-containing protein [Kitasatospora sp. NPDC094011]|uniref:RICIN domain-containing protein n=1 Tax=Kitasatospora sp. NPDC094011 TaxID=3364090 RepID=UPI00380745B1